jgi:DNA/RNA-binding domain of Phe-tRNA-synthetase-like protein
MSDIATNSFNAFNQGVQTGVRQEQERIIEIIERCPRTDNDRLIDAPTLIALIKGENK